MRSPVQIRAPRLTNPSSFTGDSALSVSLVGAVWGQSCGECPYAASAPAVISSAGCTGGGNWPSTALEITSSHLKIVVSSVRFRVSPLSRQVKGDPIADRSGGRGVISYCSASVAPSARLRHGRTPSISTSSEKTSNVRTRTIAPRTPTFVIVGSTATVRMRSAATRTSRLIRSPRPKILRPCRRAADEIASNGEHGQREREDQHRDGDPLECP